MNSSENQVASSPLSVTAGFDAMKDGLAKAIAMLERTHFSGHHPQCPVGYIHPTDSTQDIPDGPLGCRHCVCVDEIAPLRALLSSSNAKITNSGA